MNEDELRRERDRTLVEASVQRRSAICVSFSGTTVRFRSDSDVSYRSNALEHVSCGFVEHAPSSKAQQRPRDSQRPVFSPTTREK